MRFDSGSRIRNIPKRPSALAIIMGPSMPSSACSGAELSSSATSAPPSSMRRRANLYMSALPSASPDARISCTTSRSAASSVSATPRASTSMPPSASTRTR